MHSMHWDMSPEEDAAVEALLLDIAMAEREIQEKQMYGEELPDIPEIEEEHIDVDLHDNGFVVRRREIV